MTQPSSPEPALVTENERQYIQAIGKALTDITNLREELARSQEHVVELEETLRAIRGWATKASALLAQEVRDA